MRSKKVRPFLRQLMRALCANLKLTVIGMWDRNKSLIQVELGSTVVRASTEVDHRGLLGKLFGDAPPKEGNVLIEGTAQLREFIQNTHELQLPVVAYCENDKLGPTEIVIYFGIEFAQFSASSLNDLFQYIYTKTLEYNNFNSDRNALRQALHTCLEDISQDNYQDAYDRYQKIYYHAILQGIPFEIIRSISEAAQILLRNGAFDRAIPYLLSAVSLCENPEFVDITLKARVNYLAGEAFKMLGTYPTADQFYQVTLDHACRCEDSSLAFLALIGLAETSHTMGTLNRALHALREAKTLVLTEQNLERYRAALQLQESITAIYEQILIDDTKKGQVASDQPIFDQIKKQLLNCLVQTIVGTVVHKLFGVSGTMMFSIFGSTEHKFEGNTVFVNRPSGCVELRNFQKVR